MKKSKAKKLIRVPSVALSLPLTQTLEAYLSDQPSSKKIKKAKTKPSTLGCINCAEFQQRLGELRKLGHISTNKMVFALQSMVLYPTQNEVYRIEVGMKSMTLLELEAYVKTCGFEAMLTVSSPFGKVELAFGKG